MRTLEAHNCKQKHVELLVEPPPRRILPAGIWAWVFTVLRNVAHHPSTRFEAESASKLERIN